MIQDLLMYGGAGKRQQILNAATRVFAAKGFYSAKIEEIAIEAGVGKGTVYEYFANKKALFEEMVKYAIGEYTDGLKKAGTAGNDAEERLYGMFRFSLGFIDEKQDLARILIKQPVGTSNDLKEWLAQSKRRIVQCVQTVFTEGIEAGKFRRMDVKVAANIFLGTINSYSAEQIFDEAALPPGLVNDVIDVLMTGFRCERGETD